jgi:hypothetical protein
MIRTATLVVALLACALTAAAQEWDVQVEERVIEPGARAEFELPAIDPGERFAVLEFEARMDNARPGGSMFYLDLRLNGEPVLAALDRLSTRLLNKPAGVPYRDGKLLYWHSAGTGWRIVYAPDFESFGDAQGHGPEPYRFVVDVSDQVQRAAANHLSFHRLIGTTDRPLVIRNVRVKLTDAGATPVQSRYALAGVESWQVDVAQSGAITLSAGGQQYEVASSFSTPEPGWNVLGRGGQDSEWRVTVSAQAEDKWLVEARGEHYRLRRTVTVTGGRVQVADEVTNPGREPVGMIHRHTISLPEPAPTMYLVGDPDPTITLKDIRANSTLFVPLGEAGLGIAFEDDVSRCHGAMECSADARQAGFVDEHLAVGGGESYTVRWSIYPCLHGDYWRFINRVRADWGVNGLTANGPWAFLPPERYAREDTDIVALGEYLDRGGQCGVLTSGGWTYRKPTDDPPWIGFGAAVFNQPFDDYRASLKHCIQNFKAARPDIPVLVYVHCFLNSPQTPEQKEQLRDSWVTGPDGEQTVRGWSRTYPPTPQVYPTTSNSFGRAFTRTVDRIMDELGADGIYQDESNHGGREWTYNAWDQHSAMIDPATHRITALVGHVTLLSSEYRIGLHRHVRERGGLQVANGQPCLMAENRDDFPRFVEAQQNLCRAAETHLYSPLVWDYGIYRDASRLRRALAWGTVPVRLNISGTAGPFAHFFPLTTTEVHGGWILARERIIVTETGAYGWPGETVAARVYSWDFDLNERPVREVTIDGTAVVEVPEGGVAVIVRSED